MRKFHFYHQYDSMDCGPTCLRMISRFYGCRYRQQTLREKCHISKDGVSMLGICDAAAEIGLDCEKVAIKFNGLKDITPCIIPWGRNHFVVCVKIKRIKNLITQKYREFVYIADPAKGKYKLSKQEFLKHWKTPNDGDEIFGFAITFTPREDFFKHGEEECKHNLSHYLRYLFPHKWRLLQIIVSLTIASFLQLLLPFVTQSVVDVGIKNKDLNFIFLILMVQGVVFFTQLGLNLFRNWITLNVNARINLSIISDFLHKLLKLPLIFFTSRRIGDILQRVNDHAKIERILTGTSIYTLFSFCNFFIFAFVLFIYNKTILFIFLVGNILNIAGTVFFLKYRKELDFRQFHQSAKIQSSLIQTISGIHDIKLSNCEQNEIWRWERLQIDQFKISVKSLALSQIQGMTSSFFLQITTIIISYIIAISVIKESMTLGMMLSISYIIGQLSAPLSQLVSLIQNLQDAKISLERLNDIHSLKNEFDDNKNVKNIPCNAPVSLKNVYFNYDGNNRSYVLSNINVTIPLNKVTVVVGKSGCGKSTLLNLIAGLYHPQKGEILIGDTNLKDIKPYEWRNYIGCVLQNGFIFNNTIAYNITTSNLNESKKYLDMVLKTVCLDEFVNSLPIKENTIIGENGIGISQGQKQRILIARAIYNNPKIIILDEITSALDPESETKIMHNIRMGFPNSTIIMVTHRLNSIKNSDNVIVMNLGKIEEVGNHDQLILKKRLYYKLINSQSKLP